jgi:type IV secretory pathway VirB10-like protein
VEKEVSKRTETTQHEGRDGGSDKTESNYLVLFAEVALDRILCASLSSASNLAKD